MTNTLMIEGRRIQHYEPLWDFRTEASFRAAALRGSTRLRRAIERLQCPPRRKPVTGRPRTWAARKASVREVRGIQVIVADHFNISVRRLTGSRGSAALCRFRQIAMYLSRTETLASYPDIGRCFGGRHHTTVIHAFREIERAIDSDVVALRRKIHPDTGGQAIRRAV